MFDSLQKVTTPLARPPGVLLLHGALDIVYGDVPALPGLDVLDLIGLTLGAIQNQMVKYTCAKEETERSLSSVTGACH